MSWTCFFLSFRGEAMTGAEYADMWETSVAWEGVRLVEGLSSHKANAAARAVSDGLAVERVDRGEISINT